jgi:hypothetical protein
MGIEEPTATKRKGGCPHAMEGSATSDDEEPGSDKVTACTRAFEEIDAQVFAGPGRGASRSEATASDRWGGPAPATVEAYRCMFDLVKKHWHAQQRAVSRHRRTPLPTFEVEISVPAKDLVTQSARSTSSTAVDVSVH